MKTIFPAKDSYYFLPHNKLFSGERLGVSPDQDRLYRQLGLRTGKLGKDGGFSA
ncbi:hypothetical protein ACFLZQ_07285 [Thermodesulfobacteriota bacterium]